MLPKHQKREGNELWDLNDGELTNFFDLVRENDLNQRRVVEIWGLLLRDQCREKQFVERGQPWFLWFSEYDECVQDNG